jgi:Restriction endonuclease EcoRII, N-terminal
MNLKVTGPKSRKISKTLSANDTGETGGHQAGLLVPKHPPDILNFFPLLDRGELNPRHHLTFYDEKEEAWKFAFIYYNNKFFGGTRNEFRLTRMTPFIRQSGLTAGDEIILERNEEGRYLIRYHRAKDVGRVKDGILRLGSNWRIVEF